MKSLSVTLTDIPKFLWYKFVGAQGKIIKGKARTHKLTKGDVIGARKLKTGVYHVVLPHEAQKEYVLTEREGDLLMGRLNVVKRPTLILNDGSKLSQKAVPTTSQGTAFDNPRFRFNIEPKGEKEKILFKNFQWLTAKKQIPVKVLRGRGTSSKVEELFTFDEGTVFGLRARREGRGGWLVNTEGMRVAVPFDMYDKLFLNSKLIPINQIPKGGAPTQSTKVLAKRMVAEVVSAERAARELKQQQAAAERRLVAERRKKLIEEDKRRTLELEAGQEAVVLRSEVARTQSVRAVSKDELTRELKEKHRLEKASKLIDEDLLVDLGTLGEGVDDMFNEKAAPVFGKRVKTTINLDEDEEDEDDVDPFLALDTDLKDLLNAARESARKVGSAETQSEDEPEDEDDDSDEEDVEDEEGDEDQEEDAAPDTEDDEDEEDDEEEDDEEEASEEPDDEDVDDEEDADADAEDEPVDTDDDPVDSEDTDDEDVVKSEKDLTKAKVKDADLPDPQVMDVILFNKDTRKREFIFMDIEEKKDGELLVYTLYDITTGEDGYYSYRVGSTRKNAFQKSISLSRTYDKSKFSKLADSVDAMDKITTPILS